MGSAKSFSNEPRSVPAARHFVEDVLSPLGLGDVDARIVITELATNAVRHAQTPFRVSVDVDSDTIRLEVEDGAGALRIARELASDHTGRGLQIVEAVATEWGIDHRGEKKAVWVELPAVVDRD